MNNLLEYLPLTKDAVRELVFPGAVSSTNDVAREQGSSLSLFSLVITDEQTKGRGRLGREWVTPKGQGLAASLVVSIPERSSGWLPLVAGAAFVHALHQEGFGNATLKWPNDVLLEGGKLAGILCESFTGDRGVIGLGVNLRFGEGDSPTPRANSLFGTGHVRWEVVDRLLVSWISQLRMWSSVNPREQHSESRRLVLSVLGTVGRHVDVVEANGTTWSGVASDLDEHGHLMVLADSSKTLQVVASADIEHLYQ